MWGSIVVVNPVIYFVGKSVYRASLIFAICRNSEMTGFFSMGKLDISELESCTFGELKIGSLEN